MTVSFNNITSMLEDFTKELTQKAPNKTGFFSWMEKETTVKVVMERAPINNEVPGNVQRSAVVTIEPPNEELCGIISRYFLNTKIPTQMGAPERYLFDAVEINGKSII